MWLAPGTGRTSRSASDRSLTYQLSIFCVEVSAVLRTSLAFILASSPESVPVPSGGALARRKRSAGCSGILRGRSGGDEFRPAPAAEVPQQQREGEQRHQRIG